jgi:hypothetical protein
MNELARWRGEAVSRIARVRLALLCGVFSVLGVAGALFVGGGPPGTVNERPRSTNGEADALEGGLPSPDPLPGVRHSIAYNSSSADIAVHVLDERGNSLSEMPVVLSSPRNGRGQGEARFVPFTYPRLTNQDGMAFIPSSDLFDRAGNRRPNTVVHVLGLFRDPPRAEVAPGGANEGSAYVIVVPDFGRVEVRSGDCPEYYSEKPVYERVELCIQADYGLVRMDFSERWGLRKALINGAAQFDIVEVGTSIAIVLLRDSESAVAQNLDGPKFLGQDVTVALECLEFEVKGQVEIEGMEGCDAEVQIVASLGNAGARKLLARVLRPANSGALVVLGYSRYLALVDSHEIYLELVESGRIYRSGLLQASYDAEARTLHLGRVSMSEVRLVSEGRIEDSRGAPVEGAVVQLQCRESSEGAPWFPIGGAGLYAEARCETDADGHFAVGAIRGDREYRLAVRHSDFFEEIVPLSTDGPIVLRDACSLRLQLVGMSAPSSALTVIVVDPQGELLVAGNPRASGSVDLRLPVCSEVAVGFVLRGRDATVPLGTFRYGGRSMLDIGKVDIGDYVSTLQVSVSTNQGLPVRVFEVIDCSTEAVLAASMGHDTASILVAGDELKLRVRAQGFEDSDPFVLDRDMKVILAVGPAGGVSVESQGAAGH